MKRGKTKNKFAQATIFIVVAVILIGAIGVTFFTLKKPTGFNSEFSSNPEIQAKFDNVLEDVRDCMKSSAVSSLETIGNQGGYFDKPKNYLSFGLEFIPYYYFEGEITVPTKAVVETELAKAMNSGFSKCLDLKNGSDFSLNYKKPISKVLISESQVEFKIDSPVSITLANKTSVFETKEIPVLLDSELFAILNISKFYSDSHKTDPTMFCISCIGDMASKNDLYVDVIGFTNDSTIVIVSENHTSETPYLFEFLNKYTGNEKAPIINESGPVAP